MNKMAILNVHVWALLLLLNVLVNNALANPLYTSQFFNAGNARNIRHLPCVSLRTGETGVCMFAFNCVKANGTHLGTCLDRFYFGSCCRITEEPEIFPPDNSIDELNTVGSTARPIESNNIPDYSNKPKPDSVATSSTTEKATTSVYTSTRLTSTTIPPSIALSTFQTIQDNRTPPVTKAPTTLHYSRPSTTERIETTVTKKPTTVYSSTIYNFTTTERPPATRFPPRNATTQATTRRPITTTTTATTTTTTTTTTRRPITSTTKRPTTITKRPVKPSTGSSTTFSKPSTGASSTKPSSSAKPSTSTSTNATTLKPVSQETTLSSSTTVTQQKPNATSTAASSTTKRPSSSTTIKQSKPTVGTTVRPRPKPTKTTATSAKPTKTPTRPTTGDKTKPRPSQTSAKPSAKPKPTAKPTKPVKPVKPSSGSTVGTTLIVQTTAPPSSTVKTPITTTTTTMSTTTTSTTTTTTTTERPSTLTNEILPPKIPFIENTTAAAPTTTTQGFVTWSSNSDVHVTPTTSSTSSTTAEPAEVTETQWSPLTTPDGWVIIPSPSTKKPTTQQEANTEETKIPSTSKPLTSESTTQQAPVESTTSKPTVPTVTTSTPAATTTAPVTPAHLNMSDYKQVCGRRLFPESRIVGGDRSSFGKWPWQISLRQWRTSAYLHKCGAALLNENWAITAAHCVEHVPPSDLLLRIGEHDLANEEEPYGFQERRVQIVASHPQFDPRTFEYDLALLRFYEPLLPFQPNVVPICLPDDDEGYVGHTAYVTGWGRLYEDGPLPSTLQEVSVPVINNTVCESMYRNAGYIEHIPHIFICAGWRKGGSDSCEGDSGGPMVIQRPRDKRWILAGVISWGIGCAEPNQPGVYTRISEFREWINQILQF